MEFFEDWIRPELLVLIPVLILIGKILKKTQWLSCKWIPVTLGAAGILLAVSYLLAFASDLTVMQSVVTGVLQGVLCAGMSVYSHQIVKQTLSKEAAPVSDGTACKSDEGTAVTSESDGAATDAE